MNTQIIDLKICGIYDKRTVSVLRDQNISHFSFDFRPRSFNFIQGHILSDILEGLSALDDIYLHFENEPDFMVENIIAHFNGRDTSPKLVFSDINDLSYYEKFKTPFLWHYNDSVNINSILKSQYCNGLIFSLSDLHKLHEDGVFHNFVSNIYSTTQSLGKEVEFHLNIDDLSKLFPSLFEFFDFKTLGYSLNPELEVCYRNVDSNKLSKAIVHLKSIQA